MLVNQIMEKPETGMSWGNLKVFVNKSLFAIVLMFIVDVIEINASERMIRSKLGKTTLSEFTYNDE